MARARNIKPGFFKNEVLAEMPFEARLLFIGLWTLADREGRMEDRPKRIRAEIFPLEFIDADPLLERLAQDGFIVRYAVDGAKFIQIENFTKHQMPHHKEVASVIPAPEGCPQITRHAYDVSAQQRLEVFRRDGDQCLKCGSAERLSLDHIIPLACGGDNSSNNLQTLCTSCNSSKGDTAKDYRKTSIDSTLIQCNVNDDASCPPDSLIPDSLSSDSLIPDSLIPEEKPLQGAIATAPQQVAVVTKIKPAKAKTEKQQANADTWNAYAAQYAIRYGVEPVRNAKSNAQVAQLVARLGADEAPHVAAFFVTINDQFYLRSLHEFGLLVSKAEAIRTQWATGRQMNGRTARQLEDTQANINAAQEAAARIRARENGGVRNDNPFLR